MTWVWEVLHLQPLLPGVHHVSQLLHPEFFIVLGVSHLHHVLHVGGQQKGTQGNKVTVALQEKSRILKMFGINKIKDTWGSNPIGFFGVVDLRL